MPRVQVGAVSLEYFEQGDGDPTVVLVHGYRSSALIWDAMQQCLAAEGMRSVAISMRGAGGSDATAQDEDYSAHQFGIDLAAAVDGLGLEQFVLVGHSMGASTVTNYIRDHEDRVLGLVLLAGGALSDGKPVAMTAEQQAAWDERIAGYPGNTDEQHWRAEHVALSDEIRERLWQDWLNVPKERLRGIRERPQDLQSVLAAPQTPTLVVFGDRDGTVPPGSSAQGYLTLPEAVRHMHVFHGVDHSPNAVIPDRLCGVFTRFIRNTLSA